MRFVLVHGASHGAWCWDLLIPELVAQGHDAVAVELPGHGARSGEAASLGGYSEAVTDQLQGGDVLVGHSMGATVAAVAAGARPDLVGHLVLFAGWLPVEGQPVSGIRPSASPAGLESEPVDERLGSVLEETRKFTDDGSAFYWDRDGAVRLFFHDCDESLADWAFERLVPQPVAPLLEPIRIPSFWEADLPRSYILCTHDRAMPGPYARLQAARMGVSPLEIGSSHSPFFSRPADLAELLVMAVGTKAYGPLVPTASEPRAL
jgi:pimeloyl-ACP methyl ester carboxylesterase